MFVIITILFMVAFLLSYSLIPVFERNAVKRGYVTVCSPQKVDCRSLPYTGGLAMFLVFFLLSIGFSLLFPQYMLLDSIIYFLISTGVIVFFGAYDDLKEFSPWYKLLGQGIGAVLVTLFFVRTEIVFFPLWVNLGLSIFWIVLVINAFNLLDILDGLAGSVALINIVAFLCFGLYTGNNFVIVSSVVLLGGLTAFLRYNWPPARIFMGDAGSQFLGFVQAVMAISLSFSGPGHEVGIIIPLVILAVPLLDFFFVVMMRFIYKKPVFLKSNDHYVFRMLKYGVSNVNIVRIMGIFALISSGCAFIIYRVSNIVGILIFCVLIGMFFLIGIKLSRLEMDE